jgi:hypothetical protein
MKNLNTFEEFLNEANYWEANKDTKKILPVKNDKQAEGLLSGKVVTGYRVEKDFTALDVYGKEQIISKGTVLDVHILVNSGDPSHNIYVDRKEKRYFPSDYRGEDQTDKFESNTTNIG